MAAGCTNPNAVNFNPAANPEDYSCNYMLKNQGNCHWFKDFIPTPATSRSFTMSYAVVGQAWVFFHDYWPDMYIHTRNQLFNAKSSSLFKHHSGVPGLYHQDPGDNRKPFF